MSDTPLSENAEPAASGPVWIIDEDEVRFSLSFALRPRFTPESFELAEAFIARVPLDQAGCLITDVELAGALDGLALQEHLARCGSPISVVFVSRKNDLETVVRAMRGGAVNFLHKPVDPELLAGAVEEALERSRRQLEKKQLLAKLATLTRREFQVFEKVCQGLKNNEIADSLFVSRRTVEVHRRHIGRKLGYAAPMRFLYDLCAVNGDDLRGIPAAPNRALTAEEDA